MVNGTFIVAEISASHQQSYQKAVDLIKAAKDSGADAVKIQMFTADEMTFKGRFKIKGGLWDGWDLYKLYEKAALPNQDLWVPELKELAEDLGLVFLTTVYHPDAVDRAEGIGIETYKIASFEIPYIELLEKVAMTKKPVIISTGMADYDEIDRAVKIIRKVHDNIALLKCTSSYPAPPEEMNLRTIPDMIHRFDLTVGLSDHTLSTTIPAVAVVLGAAIIEKHITLKTGEGLDGGFAITPKEFLAMTKAIREAERSLGRVVYGGKKWLRRKLVKGRMVRVC